MNREKNHQYNEQQEKGLFTSLQFDMANDADPEKLTQFKVTAV